MITSLGPCDDSVEQKERLFFPSAGVSVFSTRREERGFCLVAGEENGLLSDGGSVVLEAVDATRLQVRLAGRCS